ncbi:uracil-DNA glycosylase family protein [Labrys monachus]|uniref:Uracil-DNA glycosylase n=1 Tax=Labrys monachus TaxID=217067 RepID=A0ABU0FJR9_9HYPH|nr:uracil-DNA glycosylase family protein [Labrys monachus]MDQ0394856.1 uracil-DNA glycosylase [Labrys monachus]
METALDLVIAELRACRLCRDAPRYGPPLPHEPRPVIQAAGTARICIAGQAPGARAHASGRPYTDASGVRLRGWLGIGEEAFYDPNRIAIVAMGCCFPGLDAKGGDLPPRRECAETWRERLLAPLQDIELLLLVGQYAQKWHLGRRAAGGVTATVERWREIYDAQARPRMLPLPHPSWRNTGWLKRHPWFEADVVPILQAEMRRLLA